MLLWLARGLLGLTAVQVTECEVVAWEPRVRSAVNDCEMLRTSLYRPFAKLRERRGGDVVEQMHDFESLVGMVRQPLAQQ